MTKSVAFDGASKRRYDENGYLHVESSHLTKETVNPYYGREIPRWRELGLDPEKIYMGYRSGSELEKGAYSFNGLPLQMDHHMDCAENPQKEARVGSVGTSARWNPPYVDNALTITDAEAIRALERGECRELSCAYAYDADFTPGEFGGVRYDFVMRNIRGNHVALVREGRAGRDVAVADSQIKLKGDDDTMKRHENAFRPDREQTAPVGKTADATTEETDAAGTVAAGTTAERENARATKDAAKTAETVGAKSENGPAEIVAAETGTAGTVAAGKLAKLLSKLEDEDIRSALAELFEELMEKTRVAAPAVKTSLDAADAEEIRKCAEDGVMKKVRSLTEAARAVRPLMGEVADPLAFDSAESIYKKALELNGVSTAGYAPEAYKGMTDVLVMRKSESVAAEYRAPVSADGPFRGLGGIRVISY